ncbi:MAG: M23 family metallopeptidase [Flavobacteriales bacterium]|nr:M23 family metallopeptidase [Flavobacteriales bacterium]
MLYFRKNFLFLLPVAIITAMVACSRDSSFFKERTDDDPQLISVQMAVIKAKAWHGTEYPEASYDVLWDEAIIHRSDTAYYVEAPIRGITPPYLVARSVCKEPLRIVFKVKGRHHEVRLMHIWPDREMPNASELTYADVGEYNGSISYFHADMTPTYTLVFEKGKRKYSCLYKIKPKNTIPPSGLMQVVMFSRVISIDDCFTEEEAKKAMEDDFSRVFYLSEELTQAWGQKCYLEGDGLDDVIITPPGGGNQPPGGNWPGDDEGDDDEYPPLPGTGNDGFEDTLPSWGEGTGGGGLEIPDYPCMDLEKGLSNPLKNMQILGSKNNGIPGGDYGNGRGRMHHGIDLAGSIGTPVFSMFDGTVVKAVNYFDPNIEYADYMDLGNDNMKAAVTNHDAAAGNRINIRCTVKGRVIIIKYFHLNNLAKNFNIGDNIYAGEQIGTIGNTGSASSTQSSGAHLHLEIRDPSTNNSIDPKNYFYSPLDPETGKSTKECN